MNCEVSTPLPHFSPERLNRNKVDEKDAPVNAFINQKRISARERTLIPRKTPENR